jgi:low affinity Fe/Cu permease
LFRLRSHSSVQHGSHFTSIASRIAAFAGQPIAFVIALALMILWGGTGPLFHYSDTWQLVVNTSTTIVTFLMVFLIQNSQNRDGAAMQAKLDEIIRALDEARSQFIGIEHHTDKEIQTIRQELEEECGEDGKDGKPAPDKTVDRLLKRT